MTGRDMTTQFSSKINGQTYDLERVFQIFSDVTAALKLNPVAARIAIERSNNVLSRLFTEAPHTPEDIRQILMPFEQAALNVLKSLKSSLHLTAQSDFIDSKYLIDVAVVEQAFAGLLCTTSSYSSADYQKIRMQVDAAQKCQKCIALLSGGQYIDAPPMTDKSNAFHVKAVEAVAQDNALRNILVEAWPQHTRLSAQGLLDHALGTEGLLAKTIRTLTRTPLGERPRAALIEEHLRQLEGHVYNGRKFVLQDGMWTTVAVQPDAAEAVAAAYTAAVAPLPQGSNFLYLLLENWPSDAKLFSTQDLLEYFFGGVNARLPEGDVAKAIRALTNTPFAEIPKTLVFDEHLRRMKGIVHNDRKLVLQKGLWTTVEAHPDVADNRTPKQTGASTEAVQKILDKLKASYQTRTDSLQEKLRTTKSDVVQQQIQSQIDALKSAQSAVATTQATIAQDPHSSQSKALQHSIILGDPHALIDMFFELSKNMPNTVVVAAPSTPTFVDEAKDGAWQALAEESAKRTRDSLLTQLEKLKAGKTIVQGATVFLHSEFGFAAWGLALGIGLCYAPKVKDNEDVQRVALELRRGGFRHGFLGVADKIVDTINSVTQVAGLTEQATKELCVGRVSSYVDAPECVTATVQR